MSSLLQTKVITVSIEATPERVYSFCADPRNLPTWIPSFARGVDRVGDRWVVHTEAGDATWRFVDQNALGVLDHDIVLPDGTAVHNPLRVIANGAGSTVSFTLFRRPGVTSDAYELDAKTIEGDLAQLKRVLEAPAAPSASGAR
ncbi:MAG: SRPBCC family protein [Polyangiales bacterium]